MPGGGPASPGLQAAADVSEVSNVTVAWQTRWMEVHVRIERLTAEFEKALAGVKADGRGKAAALMQVALLLSSRCDAWQARRVLSSWRRWLCGEKAMRQFGQVADELERSRQSHESEVLEATRALEADNRRLAEQAEWLRLRAEHEDAASGRLEEHWRRREDSLSLARCFAAWRGRTEECASKCGAVEERHAMEAAAWAHGAFWAWRVCLGASRRQAEARAVKQEAEVEVPRRLHRETVLHLCRAVDWAFCVQGARAEAWLLGAVLQSWSEAARSRRRRRQGAEALVVRRVAWAAAAALLRRCLTAWFIAVGLCKTTASVAQERAGALHSACSLQRIAGSLATSCHSGMLATAAWASLLCWRWFVAFQRMQRALQQMETEREASQAAMGSIGEELGTAKAEVLRERAAWQAERAGAEQKLQRARCELADTSAIVEEVLRCGAFLEQQHEEAEARGRFEADELAGTRREYLTAAQKLSATYETTMKAGEEAEGYLAECEACVSEARLEQECLMEEAAKHRDGRLVDLKELKDRARQELARHEGAEKDLLEAHVSDVAQWSKLFAQSETRRRKLEEELRTLRRGAGAAARRGEADVALRMRLERTEARLAGAQARTCQGDLEELTQRHAEMQRRCAELAAEVPSAPSTPAMHERSPRTRSPRDSPQEQNPAWTRPHVPWNGGSGESPAVPDLPGGRGSSRPEAASASSRAAARTAGTGASPRVAGGAQRSGRSPQTSPRSPGRASQGAQAPAPSRTQPRSGQQPSSPSPPPTPAWAAAAQPAAASSAADGTSAAGAGSPGPKKDRAITAAKAASLLRQKASSQQDSARQSLQERVEQMKRQIEAGRPAAARRRSP